MIGVDSGKAAIMYAIKLETPGPRYMHFPVNDRCGYDLDYFRGLCSEKMIIKRKAGQSVAAWDKIFERNEPLDMRNYARAAFKFFNWDFGRIERLLSGDVQEEIMTHEQVEKKKPKRVISRGIVV